MDPRDPEVTSSRVSVQRLFNDRVFLEGLVAQRQGSFVTRDLPWCRGGRGDDGDTWNGSCLIFNECDGSCIPPNPATPKLPLPCCSSWNCEANLLSRTYIHTCVCVSDARDITNLAKRRFLFPGEN